MYLVLGGVRSGKSAYAMQLASQLSPNPVYVATARVWDDDFKKRVERHQADRDAQWVTREEHKYLSKLELNQNVVVVDCVTLWLTNFFTDAHGDVEKVVCTMQSEIDELANKDATLIFVSNEVGMSIHNTTEMGRKFADVQGWINQYIAARASKVILMVAGIPVPIK
jgi:adenosylcobinamide kinase/adenosylcobinamide-phosphate guanylyltransferase